MNIPEVLMIGGAGVVVIAAIMTAIVAFIVKKEIRHHQKNTSKTDQTLDK